MNLLMDLLVVIVLIYIATYMHIQDAIRLKKKLIEACFIFITSALTRKIYVLLIIEALIQSHLHHLDPSEPKVSRIVEKSN